MDVHQGRVRLPLCRVQCLLRLAGRLDRRDVLVDAQTDVGLGQAEVGAGDVGITGQCLAEVFDRRRSDAGVRT